MCGGYFVPGARARHVRRWCLRRRCVRVLAVRCHGEPFSGSVLRVAEQLDHRDLLRGEPERAVVRRGVDLGVFPDVASDARGEADPDAAFGQLRDKRGRFKQVDRLDAPGLAGDTGGAVGGLGVHGKRP